MDRINKLKFILDDLGEEERKLYSDNMFPYIFSKAYDFINETYVVDYDEEDLELIIHGCNQILDGIGLTIEKSFTELGVHGFYILFQLFDYEFFGKETSYADGILDKMNMKHIVYGDIVTYYNSVNYEF